LFIAGYSHSSFSQLPSKQARFKVLALAENGGHHIRYTQAAKVWLNKLAADSSFTVDYLESSSPITEKFLSQYQLFIQLDFPPYTWSEESMKAFINYIEKGQGGGLDSIMLPYWVNSMVTRCGTGIPILWAESAGRTTSPILPPRKLWSKILRIRS
jgi:hypothetical protein